MEPRQGVEMAVRPSWEATCGFPGGLSCRPASRHQRGRDHLLKGCGLERALPLKLRIATKPSAALMRIYLEATSDWSKLNSAGQEEGLLSGR